MKQILNILLLLIGIASSCLARTNIYTLKELYHQKELAELNKDSLALAWAFLGIATIKSELENEQDSIYFYLTKGRELALNRNDSLKFEFNQSLIFWNHQHHNYKITRKLLKENLGYALLKNDDFLLMRTYLSYSDIYAPTDLNVLDSSIHYATKALDIALYRKDSIHIAFSKLNLLQAYVEVDSLREKTLELASDLLQLANYKDWMTFIKIPTYITIGKYHHKNKRNAEAIKFLNKSIVIGKETKSKGYLLVAYKNLSSIYEEIGQYQLALDIFKKEKKIHEASFNQKIEQHINQLEVANNTKQKELELLRLQQEKQIQRNQINRQWLVIISIIFVSFLFLILIAAAFINYRKRLQSNKKLLDAQNELVSMRSKFFTNISHEFRTPLTVISGIADQLTNSTHQTTLKRNSENLLDLVNQILDLSKLESGNLELDLAQNNIVNYLEYLTESFRSWAMKKRITITFHFEDREVWMDYDEKKIKHIFTNLLSNAIKFTPENGKIYVSTKTNNNQFSFQIKDTGIGISPKDLPFIFDRFYQAKENQNIGGTGIGLAFAKELCTLMNGKILVDSEQNRGTSFTVTLPITQKASIQKDNSFISKEKEKTNFKTVSNGLKFPSGKDRILVIEDNIDVSEYIVNCLKDDYVILQAYDGLAGLECALDSIPNIILTDVMMPKKNGYELCQELKKNRATSHIPIIMLTAKADEPSKLQGLEQGADAFLIKPFNVQELKIRIKNLLDIQKNWQIKFQEKGLPSNQETQTPEEIFLQEAQACVLKNLDKQNYTVDFYCRDLGISRTQLHRKLKALTGLSATQFINEIRLQEAKKFLEKGALNVSEVADMVGFQHANYFSKLYTQKFGETPNETRKS